MRTGERPVLNKCDGEVRNELRLLLLVFTCIFVPFTVTSAISQGNETEQAREILQEGGFQQGAPDAGGKGNVSGDGSSASSSNGSEGSQEESSGRFRFDLGNLSFLSVVLWIMMWGGIAVLVGLFVYLLVQLIRHRRPAPPGEDGATVSEREEDRVEEEASLDRSGMDETLSHADELAEQGRFTEAIRRMFKDAARRIERDLDVTLKKSDTNHEYLERFREMKDVQELCRVLVRAVDRFYYGGKPCDEADYRRCRKAWKQVQTRANT